MWIWDETRRQKLNTNFLRKIWIADSQIETYRMLNTAREFVVMADFDTGTEYITGTSVAIARFKDFGSAFDFIQNLTE